MVSKPENDSLQTPSIGPSPSEFRHYESLSLTPPRLPYGAMDDLLRLMDQYKWKIPSLEGRSLEELGNLADQEPREVVERWVEFCDSALQGGQALHPDLFELDKKPDVDDQAVLDWLVAEKALKASSKETKLKVEGASKAFGLLLRKEDEKLVVTGEFIWDRGGAIRLFHSLNLYATEWFRAQDAMRVN